MKVKISWWRITWRYLVVFLIISIIVTLSASSIFFTFNGQGNLTPLPWGVSQSIFVSILGVTFIGIYFLALFGFYYIIEDKCFVVKRLSKTIEYDYKNIEFIDIKESQRKKMVIFYTKTAHMRYMLGDKEGVLLETLIKKCPNVMSKEEFIRCHPEERY